ncbi:MAG: hypothetical protein H6590_03340 [Flavobacteriales bacterium]|nr:hypothetical protein [Flavobacteriales bacterium]HPF91909.1 hypothetical protein [Flavobacteriales bacterium]
MPRPRFLFLMGAFHILFGAFFFLFTGLAVDLFIETAGEAAAVIVKGLSGICFAIGLMNLMAHNSADGPALRAVLVGTLFYLLFTTSCDAYWIHTGVLKPLTWASIALRVVFAAGYVYQLLVAGTHPR